MQHPKCILSPHQILPRVPLDSHHASDFSVYTGTAGISFLALRSAILLQGDEQRSYLDIARRYLKASQSALEARLRRGHRDDVSFIMGGPGIYAQIAVVETLLGKQTAAAEAIERVLSYAHMLLKPDSTYPYEILYGTAGR